MNGELELPLAVGVDGSEPSLRALDWAADEAALRGVPLRVVHASLWARFEEPSGEDEGDVSDELARTERLVSSAVDRAARRDPAPEVSAVTVPGDAVPALLDQSRNALAVVTGSRGRGGIRGLLLGSVSLELAARADCPVVVVRGADPGPGTHGRVTLGVGEEADSAAVRFAFQEAEARGCALHALRAWRCPTHELGDLPLTEDHPALAHAREAQGLLDHALGSWRHKSPGVEVCQEAVEGTARKVLLEASSATDLLVIGAHRRQGHFGRQLGMVGHTVLHHAACPVAVVPEHI
ncbi:universal stress protein [Streptomyces sp. NPDC048172]|uniref:universal stress protein n=1 Tax=Streptomyces sp. NPDC048172 TaxID=3365505 RepID=UPI003721B564